MGKKGFKQTKEHIRKRMKIGLFFVGILAIAISFSFFSPLFLQIYDLTEIEIIVYMIVSLLFYIIGCMFCIFSIVGDRSKMKSETLRNWIGWITSSLLIIGMTLIILLGNKK